MSLRYIPAGLYPHVFMSESTLYVKMLPNKKFRSSISYYSDPKHRFTWFKLYDRNVFLVRNTSHVPDIDFDFSYNLSIFGKDNIYYHQLGLSDVLISAHNGLKELRKARRDGWRPQSDHISVFGDSGGAQIRSGTTDFVDPHEVIGWFNDCVDWAAALDIPPRPADMGNRKVMAGLAEAQNKNLQMMLSEKRDSLNMLNIVHGFNIDEMRRWIAYVRDDRCAGWACGSDNIWAALPVFQCILLPIMELPNESNKRYHLFGVSGKGFIPAMAWMARGVNISIDSTNFLRGNRYRRYINTDLHGKLNETDMTEMTNKLTPRQKLPCACPVCHSMGWWDVFKLDGESKAQHLLTIHNLWTILSFVRFWNVAAKSCDIHEYKKLIKLVFPKTYREIWLSTGYVDYSLKEGLDKSHKRFRPFFTDDPQKHNMPKLFDGEGKKSNFEKMSTFVGLGQKDSSWRNVTKYVTEEEVAKALKKWMKLEIGDDKPRRAHG